MTIPSSLKSHRDPAAEATTRDTEGQEAARELWAALALATVKQQIYRLASAEQSMPSATAQQAEGDGKLTFACAPLDDPTTEPAGREGVKGATGGQKSEHSKVSMQIDGGRLGTVHLTVTRNGTAVSVLVGVADPVQRALVELELSSLRQALCSAGLSVGSLRVISPEAPGIPLAQGRRVMNPQPTQSASSAYRSFRGRQETDADESLDVVG